MSSSSRRAAPKVFNCITLSVLWRSQDSEWIPTFNRATITLVLTYNHCSFNVQLTMSYCMIKKVGIII